MKISAMYHVKDEEEFLFRSLLSVVPWVDETIIFDTASSDRTPDICRAFGINKEVKYYRFEEDFETREGGEKAFREEAIAHCNGDWILQLDGDCVLSNGWREAVNTLINDSNCGCIAFKFYEHIGSYEYTSKPDSSSWKEWMPTLFRKHDGLIWNGATHGALQIQGATLQCPEAAWFHYGYAKRDIYSKCVRGIERGDRGEPKKEMIALNELGPWEWIGWEAEPHTYPQTEIPWVMRDLYGVTYFLDMDPDGRIFGRRNA